MGLEYLVKITEEISVIDYEILRDSLHTFTFMILSDLREVMTFCKKDEIQIWIYKKPKYLELYRERHGHFDFMYEPCHHKFSITSDGESGDKDEIFSSIPYSQIVSYIKKCV